MSDKCNAPVGVFDSGVGGLTVARESQGDRFTKPETNR